MAHMTKAELFTARLIEISNSNQNLEDYLIYAHAEPSVLAQQRRFELIFEQARARTNTNFKTLDEWVENLTPWLKAFNSYRSTHEHTNSSLWIDYSILSSPPDRVTDISANLVDAINTHLTPKAKVDYLVYLLTTYISYGNYHTAKKKPLLAKDLLENVAALELTKEESSTIGLSKKSLFLAAVSEAQSLRLIKQWYNLPSTVIDLYKHLIPYPDNTQDASKWWLGLIKNNTAKLNEVQPSIELPEFN